MYSGAFRRFFAYLIDCVVIIGCYMLISSIIAAIFYSNPLLGLPMFGIWFFSGMLTFVWLYYSTFESSKWQATVGKRALGLKVVDLEGNRISFFRATGRFSAKFLSQCILNIGYLMIFWTKKKQGLHDKLASTLVLHNKESV